MTVRYFTDQFLAKLKHSLPENLGLYSRDEQWIDEYSAGSRYCNEASVAVDDLRPLEVPTDTDLKDVENSQIIYTDFITLSPLHASDERLWAYLCHVKYWRYMRARWPATTEGAVRDRYFMKTQGAGSLVRNGISRLWWFGHLTYSLHGADKYELTRVLLSNQDIQQGLLQRRYGKNRMIVSTVLEFVKANHTKLLDVGQHHGGVGAVVKRMFIDINLAGGVYLLDALDKPRFHEILHASVLKFSESAT